MMQQDGDLMEMMRHLSEISAFPRCEELQREVEAMGLNHKMK